MKPQEQTYSKSRRLKNQIKAVVTNPYNIIVLIAVVLLVYLIVLPLLDMIATTCELAQRDIRAVGGGKAGDFTLYYWQRLLASELSWTMLIKPLINSLVIGVCVSVCAILLGSILAWLMVRSDLPFKKFFSLAVIIPYMIPSWCKSQAWLSMFKTARLGGAPGFMASLGLDVPEWLAYGPVAIIIVLTLHYYAYTYLLVSSALNSINSELEEMGEIQGAGKAMILRKITLPLVLPAILSAVILTFSKAIGTFGTINYLGSPVQYYTLSSQLYMNSNSRDTQTGFAMAILHRRVRQPEADRLPQVLRHHRRQGRPIHPDRPWEGRQAGYHCGAVRVLRSGHHHANRHLGHGELHAQGRYLLPGQLYPPLLDWRIQSPDYGGAAGHLQE